MKDFTDVLIDAIIENEMPRLDKIMNEVTQNISRDFARETFRLLDEYYDNYTPIHYVRVYGKKRKLRTKSGITTRKPRPGQISLHAALTRGGEENALIGVHGGSYSEGYIGGVTFSEGLVGKHLGRMSKDANGKSKPRISEWNIVENFLFAGDADEYNLKGDWRSVGAADYNYPSANEEMNMFMDFYGPTLDKHYNDALKKFL